MALCKKLKYDIPIYHIKTNNMDIQKQKELYLETLNEKEMKAYLIAKSFLGTSFQLEKSVGFLKWKAKQTD